MQSAIKYWWLFLLAVLIATKPSVSNVKNEYSDAVRVRKTVDLIVASKYEITTNYLDSEGIGQEATNEYYAIACNVIESGVGNKILALFGVASIGVAALVGAVFFIKKIKTKLQW